MTYASSAAALFGTAVILAGCATSAPPRRPHAQASVSAAPTAADKELATRAETAIALSKGTPGQEAGNFLQQDWPHDCVLMLKGERSANAGQLAAARATVLDLTQRAEAGPAWPKPPHVRIPRAPQAPVIDGTLDDPAWQTAAKFEGLYLFNTTAKVTAPATTWFVTWDDTYLYFAFDCADEDIVAPDMPRDQPVFAHDCVEMFILPDLRLGMYWELVIGPTGCLFDALHHKRFDGWGPVGRPAENIVGLKFATKVKGTPNDPVNRDTGYTVEVAVPFKELPTYTRGNPPQPGDILRFMLVRLDENQGPMKPYAFVPLQSWGHNIWNHAEGELTK